MRIYKFTLGEDRIGATTQPQTLPGIERILSVANQREQLVLYALSSTEPDAGRDFHIFVLQTGWNVPASATHFIGTVLFANGDYVLHVFADQE